MKMKQAISVACVAFAMMLSTSCSNTTTPPATGSETPSAAAPETSSETPAPAGGEVQFDIMQFKVEIKDALQSAIDQYTAENPNVKINMITVGGGSDYNAALKAQMASGNEPTIFNVDGPQAVADWKSKLTDMSDTASAKAAIPALLAPVTVDNQIFGVPYNQEGYGFIYNKALFEKAGIDPKSIQDFASLKTAVETLDAKKADLGLDAVFAFPVKETWVTGLHLSNVFIEPELPNIIESFNAKEIEMKYSKEFQEVFDLQNKYSVQPTVSMDYSTQVEELFSLGKVAMIQQGNWAYPTIAEVDEDYAKDTGLIPIPCGTENKGMMPSGPANYWAVNATSSPEQIAAAKSFIDWLNTSEKGKTIVLEQLKFVPAYSGYDVDKISDPLSKEVYTYSQEGKTYLWTFPSYPTNWGMGVVGAELQKYAGGQQSWEDTMEIAKKAWSDARK